MLLLDMLWLVNGSGDQSDLRMRLAAFYVHLLSIGLERIVAI